MSLSLRRPQRDPDPSQQSRIARPLSEHLWSWLIGLLVFISIFIAALPIFAIVRGTSAGMALALAGNASLLSWLGLELALVALGMGAFFFAYSLKYYLATATILLLAFFGPGRNGNASSQHQKGFNGLARIIRRGSNGSGYPGGTDDGHLDLGYHPFVSIHNAPDNQQRV